MTVNNLADRVGLSPTPCLRRTRRLEKDGIIKGYAAHVDQVAVGVPINGFVGVTPVRQAEAELPAFEVAVAAAPEVMECNLVTGTSDNLLRVVAADLFAYERFLKSVLTPISGIASIQSSFALRQVAHRIADSQRRTEKTLRYHFSSGAPARVRRGRDFGCTCATLLAGTEWCRRMLAVGRFQESHQDRDGELYVYNCPCPPRSLQRDVRTQ